DLDVAVLARQNRVTSDEDAASDTNPAVVVALGVEQAVVIDDDIAADVNLVRMPEDDVLSEDDVPAARSQEKGIQRFPEHEAQRASLIAPAIQTGQTGRCSGCGLTPAASAIIRVSSSSVVTSPPARM